MTEAETRSPDARPEEVTAHDIPAAPLDPAPNGAGDAAPRGFAVRLSRMFPEGFPFRTLPVLLTLLAVGIAVLFTWRLWNFYMGAPWTRDATVRAYVVTMAPEVAGRIVGLPVVDNQYVRKGDLLVEIDPTNYQIAVRQAEATVQQTEANVQSIEAQVAVQQAQIEASKAHALPGLGAKRGRHRPKCPAVGVAATPAGGRAQEWTGVAPACGAASGGAERATPQR
jgi:hypothetical protein